MREDLKAFFLEPKTAKQRQYEALRAYVIEEAPALEAARGVRIHRSLFVCPGP